MKNVASKLHRTTRAGDQKKNPSATQDENIRPECFYPATSHSEKESKKPLIVVAGPTGSGKTNLAIFLAKKINGELVSADSRQVYQGLDVGTAKNSRYPHHLINIVQPGDEFSISDYLKLAIPIIKSIHARGRVPIVVGGTGYYIDALLYENRVPLVPPNTKLRSHYESKTTAALYARLLEKDAPRAKRIDPDNRRRIIRALEIIDTIGKIPRVGNLPRYNHLILMIDLNRQALYKRIDQRVEKMIKNGLIKEAAWLLTRVSPGHELAKTIGYRQAIEFIQGKIDQRTMADMIKFDTHRLARKQLGWWRRYSGIKHIKNHKQALYATLALVGRATAS